MTAPAPSPPLATARPGTARALALALLEALNRHDSASALALFAADATFEIVPAGVRGPAATTGRAFLQELLAAFPDLLLQPRALTGTDAQAVVELKMEGTQATDLLGILNQEKHVDVDQAWMVRATAGTIVGLRAYWCQNQLYRRLAVKRLDRISILG